MSFGSEGHNSEGAKNPDPAEALHLHDVPPLPYRTDVLGKLAKGWDPNRLDELLPHRWEPERVPP